MNTSLIVKRQLPPPTPGISGRVLNRTNAGDIQILDLGVGPIHRKLRHACIKASAHSPSRGRSPAHLGGQRRTQTLHVGRAGHAVPHERHDPVLQGQRNGDAQQALREGRQVGGDRAAVVVEGVGHVAAVQCRRNAELVRVRLVGERQVQEEGVAREDVLGDGDRRALHDVRVAVCAGVVRRVQHTVDVVDDGRASVWECGLQCCRIRGLVGHERTREQ